MKKLLLFFGAAAAIIVFSGVAFAGNPPKTKKPKKWIANDSLYIFNRHKKIFYLGYGTGTISNNYITPVGFTTNTTNQTGPVYFKFERAISPFFSVGLNAYWLYDTWYTSYQNDVPRIPVTYTRTYKRYTYGALARFNYHQHVNRKIDSYIGVGIGYGNVTWQRLTNNPSYNYNDTPPASSPLVFEATLGARYLLGPHWLIYVEAGYARSIFQAGLSFNIPKP